MFALHTTALATLVHNSVIKLAALPQCALPLTAQIDACALVSVLLHFNFDLQTYGAVVKHNDDAANSCEHNELAGAGRGNSHVSW